MGDNQLDVLTQRTWIIHWSLFVFVNLNVNGGISLMLSFMTEATMLNTIQTNCPHILRYLAMCIVFNNSATDSTSKIIAVIQQERETYSDPLTEFLAALYIDYDFNLAQETLKQIEEVWKIDFFLSYYKYPQFLNSARVLIFETFCKVHNRIAISEIGRVLDLPLDEH